jgi:hypothetical protein
MEGEDDHKTPSTDERLLAALMELFRVESRGAQLALARAQEALGRARERLGE